MSKNTKALQLLRSGKVCLERSVYFKVSGSEDYDVTIKPDGSVNCTCVWGSLNPGSACSHVLACFEWLDKAKMNTLK